MSPTPNAKRRALQIAVAVASLVPIGAGLAGVWTGADFLAGALPAGSADSHFRYLSGLLLAIGLAYASAIPDIERHQARFTLLTAIVAAGGLARLLGVALTGALTGSVVFPLVMELLVTPGLALWQRSVAKASAPGGG